MDIFLGSASSNGSEHRDHSHGTGTRDSRDSRDDREDSGSEDDSAGRIRVGKDYQVITPNWVPPERKNLIRYSIQKLFSIMPCFLKLL